ncbi:MAG: gliding motility-associated C-terminal domain-containing protein [Bacteroidota bacterium]
MNKKIIVGLLSLICLSHFLRAATIVELENPSFDVSNVCLSFVFVPSDYNGQTISCHNSADGSLTISAFNGTPPYSYVWEDGSQSVERTNLAAGTYSVTVSDDNGCTLSSSLTLSAPAALEVNLSSSTEVTCTDSSDGTLTTTTSGGTPPYSFEWSNGSQSAAAQDLPCGNHTLTVTDANGCEAIKTFELTCPNLIEVDMIASSNYGGFNVTCPESTDGVAIAIASAGMPPYTFTWSNGSTGASAANLPGGTNTVTVTDFKGCQVTAVVELSVPTPMQVEPIIQSDYDGSGVSCLGQSDGQVFIEVTNGTAPYTYAWDNGETTQLATSLSAGLSKVTVTDANGCVVESSVGLDVYTVSVSTEILSNYNGVPISCNGGDDGIIRANVTAGVSSPPDVTYTWSNGDDDLTAENLFAGTYIVTVTSPYGCSAVAQQTIDEPTPVSGTAQAISDYNGFNVSINGSNDGSAEVVASGGISPYSILWENGETDLQNSNLIAGTQNIGITDANGCQTEISVVLTEPTPLTGFAGVVSDYHGEDISCTDEADGSAFVLGSGAVPPYTYEWSNNALTDSINELGAGIYEVTITDANGATFVTEIELFEPSPIELQVSSTPSSNPPDGTAQVIASGGTLPYSYSWDDPFLRSEATIDQLAPDWYRVTVTDANGCQAEGQVEVGQSSEINCIPKNMTLTPNGDGKNDQLNLSCIHTFNNEVEVYDRWGNQIFGAIDYAGDWEALQNNAEVPDGGYFYIIRVGLPTGKKTFKGSITIIR